MTKIKPTKKSTGKTQPKPQAADKPLAPMQQRFVEEYLVDLNGTQAAIRAGYSAKTAGSQAERLLRNVEIAKAVEAERQKLSERTHITQDWVLKRWAEIVQADPNDLIQYRRLCCRYCFGNDHLYQWRDEEEYERACRIADQEERRAPSDEGGYGFDHQLRPHPKCPQCHGEGHGDVFVHDTRDLTGPAAVLYDGVKITKNGLEVMMQDRAKALENIARHLGMFNDKLTLKGDAENPLVALLQQVSGNTLKPVDD